MVFCSDFDGFFPVKVDAYVLYTFTMSFAECGALLAYVVVVFLEESFGIMFCMVFVCRL